MGLAIPIVNRRLPRPVDDAKVSDHPPSSPSSPRPGARSGALRGRLKNLLARARRRGGDVGDDALLEELIEERLDAGPPSNPQERLMLANILHLEDTRVEDVMVPRADIIAIEISTGLEEVLAICRDAGHSRYPVYRESLDDVLGMVHIKDLLRFWGTAERFTLASVMRKALFVPPSMPILDLLSQMRATRHHMALVVDEYGGIDGLATIEDLVEEIVGEIEDEHDVEEGPNLIERPDGTLEANARMPIEELEERLGCELRGEIEEENVDTLAGLVFALVGRVPQRGELITHPSGIEFEVLDADPRRLRRLKVRVQPRPDAGEARVQG